MSSFLSMLSENAGFLFFFGGSLVPSVFPFPSPGTCVNWRRSWGSKQLRSAGTPRRAGMSMFEGGKDEHGPVIRHCFTVKSYEVDSELKLTMETLMKYMQVGCLFRSATAINEKPSSHRIITRVDVSEEAAINHLTEAGLSEDWSARTPEMCRRNLMWVLRRTGISICHYPSWREVLELTTWFNISSKGIKFIYHLQDGDSGELMARAFSDFVVVNKTEMKLSREVDQVIREMESHSLKLEPVIFVDMKKLRRFDVTKVDNVRKTMTTIWSDIDPNAHVSNYKYINWILEGLPRSITTDYKLGLVLLEIKKGSGPGSNLKSLSTELKDDVDADSRNKGVIKFDHLLALDDGTDIVTARTEWRPRHSPLA